MIDFDTLYRERVERCSHETAYSRAEAEALYTILMGLPNGVNVVEIGVEFGRSTTVIGTVAKEKQFHFTAIDSWLGEYSPAARKHVEEILVGEWDLPINLSTGESGFASLFYERPIHLIHIDGDHTYSGVMTDCLVWLPKVVDGGWALFDDYGHQSLPEVIEAVSAYMRSPMAQEQGWQFVSHHDNRLGVFQKRAAQKAAA